MIREQSYKACLSCSLIVLKVMGRFKYIPTYIGIKRKHCGQVSTLATWVYTPHSVCFLEIRDSANPTQKNKKQTLPIVRLIEGLENVISDHALFGLVSLGVWFLPTEVLSIFSTRTLRAGRCIDRNPEVVSGHSLYQSLVPSLLLVA